MGQMAEAYIELAAAPAPGDAPHMPFPSHLRRSTKNLSKARHNNGMHSLTASTPCAVVLRGSLQMQYSGCQGCILPCRRAACLQPSSMHPACASGAHRNAIYRMGRGDNVHQAWLMLAQIPVVSVEVAVDPGGRYGDLPHFSHFGEGITFVGGINRPKRIVCYDRCAQNLPLILLLLTVPSCSPSVWRLARQS